MYVCKMHVHDVCVSHVVVVCDMTYPYMVVQWVEARRLFQEAADLLDYDRKKLKTMWGQFWASHQRFFKYLCIAAKVPEAVKLAKRAIEQGKVSHTFACIHGKGWDFRKSSFLFPCLVLLLLHRHAHLSFHHTPCVPYLHIHTTHPLYHTFIFTPHTLCTIPSYSHHTPYFHIHTTHPLYHTFIHPHTLCTIPSYSYHTTLCAIPSSSHSLIIVYLWLPQQVCSDWTSVHW